MRLETRIQKLEKKFNINSKLWAVFNVSSYEDPIQQEAAQSAILKNYLSTGAPHPDCKIFLKNALPKQQEGFLYSFTSE